MRRQRSIQFSLAFLAVSIGIAAGPPGATVIAADGGAGPDVAVPVDGAAPPPLGHGGEPEPAPDTTEPTPVPDATVSPTTAPVPDATVPPTTAPVPDPTIPPTTAPVPDVAITPPAEPSNESPDPIASEPELPEPRSAVEGIDGLTRNISFPVQGPVQYANDWGACRDDCSRHHEGTDLIGVRMQPLLAAVDGTVTRIRFVNAGTAGSVITVTGADGWYYNYFHINDDTPGTDDGAGAHEWQVSPGLTIGSAVRAGQVIGYMGDSGNAEGSVPHLHFEIRTPDRTPVNPYHSLAAAQRRQTCEEDPAETLAQDPLELSPAAVVIVALDGDGYWLIDIDGHLFADGSAARTQPANVRCQSAPEPSATDAPVVVIAAAAEAARPGPEESASPDPEPVLPAAEPAPALADVPIVRRWTVQRGETLWGIVQHAYGASDAGTTVAWVDMVFNANRHQLTDPDMLNIGLTLELPYPA